MSALKEAVGQLLIAGFEHADARVEGAIKTGRIGGVILFSRNLGDAKQISDLTDRLKGMAPKAFPLWMCVDQEGGKVQRVAENAGVERIENAASVGARGDTAYTYELGKKIAEDIKRLGFNVNFAPVLDIDTRPDNPIIGERAFGSDAQTVAAHGCAIIKAHLDSGVVPCGKHFPGHGDTTADSHLELPVSDDGLDALLKRELVPFRAAIEIGLPMVMTAHILMRGLGDMHPATLSSTVLTDILRERLSYEGLIVSDDLEMNAIGERYSVERAVRMSLLAGADLFLICRSTHLWYPLRDAIADEAKSDKRLADAVMRAAERVEAAKSKYLEG